MRTLQIKRIKAGEWFKPIGSRYAAYTKEPSRTTGIKINAVYPYTGKMICCVTEKGETYTMHETEKVIRW